MIIENVCLLLEIFSIVICLHYLYDEKFRLDISTICVMSIDMIIMTIINFYDFPQVFSIVIYPIILIYCTIKFGYDLQALIVNNVLYIAFVSGIQFAIFIIYFIVTNINVVDIYSLLFVNFFTLTIIILFQHKVVRLHKISVYLQNKERLLTISLGFCLLISVIALINYKNQNGLIIGQYVILFVAIFFVCILSIQLSKYKIKSKETEAELKIHKIYENSFSNLIESIRSRQHEFDNHINTIYSQHYVYSTYEELVKAQSDYCDEITKENKFNKLLTNGNPIITGFLYGKIVEIDKLGINLSYEISIEEMEIGIPVYKIIELLGNLINNAVEAIQQSDGMNNLYILVEEHKKKLRIVVRNENAFIEYDKLHTMFLKGNSSKGEGRGLGLYNVKKICNDNKLIISCNNERIDGKNWVSFKVENKQETI